MNLRKRKSTERQAEKSIHNADNMENTESNFLSEEERLLNRSFQGGKRVKLEETKAVFNEALKNEDDGNDINDCIDNDGDWEEVDGPANKRVSTKVSHKVMCNYYFFLTNLTLCE